MKRKSGGLDLSSIKRTQIIENGITSLSKKKTKKHPTKKANTSKQPPEISKQNGVSSQIDAFSLLQQIQAGRKRPRNLQADIQTEYTIKRYEAAFPEIVEPIIGKKSLESLESEDKEKLLNSIKLAVANKNNDNTHQISIVAQHSLLSLETLIAEKTPIRAQGLNRLAFDKAFIDTLKEAAIELTPIYYTAPHWRLLLQFLQTLLQLHNANIENDKPPLNNVLTQPINATMLNIEKDLDKYLAENK